MKRAIITILLFATCVFAEPTIVYDPVREVEVCQYHASIFQWDIIDSNMGVVTYRFAELPPYTVVDANIGRVEFTPQETGVFNIKLIATCESADPNGCLWPEEQRKEMQITVNPSAVWDLHLVVSSE